MILGSVIWSDASSSYSLRKQSYFEIIFLELYGFFVVFEVIFEKTLMFNSFFVFIICFNF